MTMLSLLAVVCVASAAAQTPWAANTAKHYPPSPDTWANLTWALTGPGAPGIYNSSHTPDSQYGMYNWCNMPHVRAQEYVVPGDEYELVYVEAVQRHHKRTPYASNTLFHEDASWDCPDTGPYAHARAATFSTAPVYWQGAGNPANPFEKAVGGFVNSTCRFPSITTDGLEDARQHGADFGGVYADLLGFLPSGSERHAYAFRVTNNVITSATLSAFAVGLHPCEAEYAAQIQPLAYDSLEPTFACPAAARLLSLIRAEPEWQAHLSASAALMRRIDAVAHRREWQASYDPAYDNFSAKQCHARALPLPLSQADADTVYRLGQWEYAYTYRASRRSTAYAALKMGAWMRELSAHLRADDGVKYRHNFAHDGSVAALLGLLQAARPMWPGMGAELVFEVWRASGQEDRVRVLWSGRALETDTPLGTLDMVALRDLLAYLDDTIPADLVSACA
ncbi:unnamed protein product [Cutaneotrichosporon oleaginosum]